MSFLTAYLVLINLFAFVLYGVDKRKAKRGSRRIRESTLLATAILGGSIGAFLGMRVFHHKTKHPQFYIGIPVIFAVQAALGIFLVWKFRV